MHRPKSQIFFEKLCDKRNAFEIVGTGKKNSMEMEKCFDGKEVSPYTHVDIDMQSIVPYAQVEASISTGGKPLNCFVEIFAELIS